jgi:hypothetical protein
VNLPPREHVRSLLVRGLGAVHLVAFLSLWSQLDVLFGSRGLLPVSEWIDRAPFFRFPSIFHLCARDGMLHACAALGSVLSVLVLLGKGPRFLLPILWALSLSFTVAGSQFFSFQWDTLLLEATFFVWLAVLRPGNVTTALLLFLVVKLHVESGLSKLLTGDATWRDLTAVATYYETAPLPTPLAWWAHQLPMPVHKATSLLVLVVEIGAPALVVAPHRVRGALFVVLAGLQGATELTANYGFFNLLTALLCVVVLDDDHLAWIARFFRKEPLPKLETPPRRAYEVPAACALAALSILPFVCRFSSLELPLVYEPFRTLNAYHLFATMTLDRCEPVIEGSQDGETWEEYELRWKPGDPRRAPSFVAPHQPRVDFLLWFSRLHSVHDTLYLERLCQRLMTRPDEVRSLFARMPFEGKPPRFLRIQTYQYNFTKLGDGSGAWWERTLLPRETEEISPR